MIGIIGDPIATGTAIGDPGAIDTGSTAAGPPDALTTADLATGPATTLP